MTLRVLVIGTLLVILAGFAIGAYYYIDPNHAPTVRTAPPRP
jgi:hypothetical protein